MSEFLKHDSVKLLWRQSILAAEERLALTLPLHLEEYLTELLIRFSDKPDLAQQLLAKNFLKAQQQKTPLRVMQLQTVGDQCLLYAGLFPQAAEAKLVTIRYFVEIGQTAYAHVSHAMHDLFWLLAKHFVRLMDVLQSLRPDSTLMPLMAYEQWREVGSERAYMLLKSYTNGTPIR